MSRSRRCDSYVVFTVVFTEPGGVTVPGSRGADGAQVLLDTGPDGRPHLPGTSLAGALRELVRDRGSAGEAERLFGAAPEAAEDTASRIWVLGSRLSTGGVPASRSSVRIDRARRAAAASMLRTDEIVPAGTGFEVFLRWPDASPDELARFAGWLAGWRPLIGSGASRGRGRCVTAGVRYGTLHLDDPEDLLAWLTGNGPDLARQVATINVTGAAGDVAGPLLRLPVAIRGPWRTGSGAKPERGSGEVVPMLTEGGRFVVPGSGVKGVFRSRAEFILRSVGHRPEPCLDQQCGTGPCWPCRVFGRGGGRETAGATVGARALVRFADTVVTGGRPVQRTHNAIDRFTGGTLPGALYTMEALEDGAFEITVEECGTIPAALRTEIGAVFALIVQDLNDGIIGMGGHTARGYGSVSVAADRLPGVDQARQVLAAMLREAAHAAT